MPKIERTSTRLYPPTVSFSALIVACLPLSRRRQWCLLAMLALGVSLHYFLDANNVGHPSRSLLLDTTRSEENVAIRNVDSTPLLPKAPLIYNWEDKETMTKREQEQLPINLLLDAIADDRASSTSILTPMAGYGKDASNLNQDIRQDPHSPTFSTAQSHFDSGALAATNGRILFDAVFGDHMVLQHGSQAAVFGFFTGDTPRDCVGVEVYLYQEEDHQQFFVHRATTETQVNGSNHFPPQWRAARHNKPASWKVLLPPQPPGGNYTIRATCVKSPLQMLTSDGTPSSLASSSTLYNVTFGDVWFCTGQSNMGLPLLHTFDRDNTMQDILQGQYSNIRIMAGHANTPPYGNNKKKTDFYPPAYGSQNGSNPWMTAEQAVNETDLASSKLLQFGATCWHFAQHLVDQGLTTPIGLIQAAVGESRISYFMDEATIQKCQAKDSTSPKDGTLFVSHVLPFVHYTIKGWIWYQGEHNMNFLKGSATNKVGYACQLRGLINHWRSLWSKTPNTTHPLAPFGIVTLASSASMGRYDYQTNLGAMRHAQTLNYGVLPSPDLPQTFLAQAYDLDDKWGAMQSPCFHCGFCSGMPARFVAKNYNNATCSRSGLQQACQEGVCAVAQKTPPFLAELHPRNKKAVGERLAVAAYNLMYGGTQPFTGPTLQGCSLVSSDSSILEVRFNSTLLRGDRLAIKAHPPLLKPKQRSKKTMGGSQLWVQVKSPRFCLEPLKMVDNSNNITRARDQRYYCPAWAGGSPKQNPVRYSVLDEGWIMLNYTLAPNSTNAIHVDLSPLPPGKTPTAIRYAWGFVDCCDHTDSHLYVDKGCSANCPIRLAQSQLPANPFQAKIIHGRCQCVRPQACKG